MAIDIAEDKLMLAKEVGAAITINATNEQQVVEASQRHIPEVAPMCSIDALGDPVTCHHSVSSLRKRGKHIQVGLLVGDHCNTELPMDKVVANELEIYGSHGIQAYRYSAIFDMIAQKKMNLARLISQTVALEKGVKVLESMDQFRGKGITVINEF